TGLSFFYDGKIVNDDVRVTIKMVNSSLKNILEDLSTRAGLRFKVVNNVISVNLKADVEDQLSGTVQQSSNVRGKVVSSADGEPLPGVSVQLKGVAIGTTTDFDGFYELKVPDHQAILVFSYLGFKTIEEQVGNRTEI